jgi:hypothetical protein
MPARLTTLAPLFLCQTTGTGAARRDAKHARLGFHARPTTTSESRMTRTLTALVRAAEDRVSGFTT